MLKLIVKATNQHAGQRMEKKIRNLAKTFLIGAPVEVRVIYSSRKRDKMYRKLFCLF